MDNQWGGKLQKGFLEKAVTKVSQFFKKPSISMVIVSNKKKGIVRPPWPRALPEVTQVPALGSVVGAIMMSGYVMES